ncbi:MAG: spore germination protein [Firmicutes bacterium]|nr:spore germination protein [Dethiobacter sp.]MBS3887883.1 spore germination protein [Bacillota bacterium]MBS4053706.1 spore germination protein [Thermaerobacter sp.]
MQKNREKGADQALKLPPPHPIMDEKDQPLGANIGENLALLKQKLGGSDDVVFREFKLDNASELPAVVVFIDGLTNKDHLQRDLLAPLMLFARQTGHAEWGMGRRGFAALKNHLLTLVEIKEASTLRECVEAVLAADAVLLIHGSEQAILLGVKTWEHRGIMEPTSERTVRGPKDGFNELFKSNIALVRRRIKSPYLRVKYARIGRRTQTDIAILYEDNLTDPALVAEVYRRLQYIDVDGILDSGYIEQYIEDSPYSPFPQVQYTERPDRVAAALLEGRVAIMVDGTPFALMVPAIMSNFLPTPEDHYERWTLMTGVRWIRTISLLIGVLLPALYVAITTFHHEMIPRHLVIAIAAARVGVPFPAMVEALIMEITFELLREGGIRIPGPIGPTIGIVGGIIIGQAAVTAGLVSPIMVVVVALTAIGSFAVPSFNVGLSLRLLRFPLILLAGAFGLYGVVSGIIVILMHAVSLKSFGIPYLSPIAPSNLASMKDTLVRAPLWMLTMRPQIFHPRQGRRINKPSFIQHDHERGGRHDEGNETD